jgi:hypothetical protein
MKTCVGSAEWLTLVVISARIVFGMRAAGEEGHTSCRTARRHALWPVSRPSHVPRPTRCGRSPDRATCRDGPTPEGAAALRTPQVSQLFDAPASKQPRITHHELADPLVAIQLPADMHGRAPHIGEIELRRRVVIRSGPQVWAKTEIQRSNCRGLAHFAESSQQNVPVLLVANVFGKGACQPGRHGDLILTAMYLPSSS